MMITLCSECDNVTAETRKRPPTQWTCIRHKRVAGGSFVAPEQWMEHEPYLRCRDVNAGACPLWSPARHGQAELIMEQARD